MPVACQPGRLWLLTATQFAQYLTTTIQHHPNITLVREEVVELPAAQITIVATGPLTSPALTAHMQSRLGSQHLYFYDALSPIVAAESIDQSKTFFASRYDVGDGDDYLNCPLDRATYEQFCTALVAAECVKPHAFEQEIFFEGCLPIEEMARRGPETLAFGPLKPVGLRRAEMPDFIRRGAVAPRGYDAQRVQHGRLSNAPHVC